MVEDGEVIGWTCVCGRGATVKMLGYFSGFSACVVDFYRTVEGNEYDLVFIDGDYLLR